MEIRKLSDSNYTASITTNEIEMINSMISDLSDGKPEIYEVNNNNSLFDKMISRLVASEVFKRDIKFPDTGFIVVSINMGDRVLNVSVGNVSLETNFKLSDVIYM